MSHERIAGAGVTLSATRYGSSSGPTLVLLHGGGQTRRAWAVAAERLAAEGWEALAVDLRGHGRSDRSADGVYGIDRFAADVAAVVASCATAPILVGASLGGLSSLVAAGELRAQVRGIVLVDVAHRTEATGASRILHFMRAHPEGFESLEQAAEAIAAYVPHRRRRGGTEGLRQSLRRTGGRWIWHWDPRILDGMPSDGLPPMWSAERLLGAARGAGVPIHLVRGEASDVVTDETARAFVAAVPQASASEVAGARHMVVGDSNEGFLDAMRPFLQRLRDEPRSRN
ncbi:MAG: alpha/beta hydrolase [Myxococcales bacterium]|nr:alpha/beta hydrolase [Myxococcales bacterium]